VCWCCLPKIIKITPCLSELQLAKVGSFFETQCIKHTWQTRKQLHTLHKTASVVSATIQNFGRICWWKICVTGQTYSRKVFFNPNYIHANRPTYERVGVQNYTCYLVIENVKRCTAKRSLWNSRIGWLKNAVCLQLICLHAGVCNDK